MSYIDSINFKIPNVSIITPVFNGSKFISSTINSVINACKNISYQYIIVDDGSTDSTLSELKKFRKNKFIEIYSKSNSGEAETVNFGLSKAKSKFSLIVNADDPLIGPEIFNDFEKYFEADDQIVAVYCDWQVIDFKNSIIKKIFVKDYSFKELFGNNNCLPGPGTIFLTNSAKKIGGRQKKWKFVSDFDFWLRLSQQGNFFHRPQILGQWRIHDASTSVRNKGKLMAQERIDVIQNFIKEFNLKGDITNYSLGNAYLRAARLSLFCKSISGRKLCFFALKNKQFDISIKDMILTFVILLNPISRNINLFLQNKFKFIRIN